MENKTCESCQREFEPKFPQARLCLSCYKQTKQNAAQPSAGQMMDKMQAPAAKTWADEKRQIEDERSERIEFSLSLKIASDIVMAKYGVGLSRPKDMDIAGEVVALARKLHDLAFPEEA